MGDEVKEKRAQRREDLEKEWKQLMSWSERLGTERQIAKIEALARASRELRALEAPGGDGGGGLRVVEAGAAMLQAVMRVLESIPAFSSAEAEGGDAVIAATVQSGSDVVVMMPAHAQRQLRGLVAEYREAWGTSAFEEVDWEKYLRKPEGFYTAE